MSELPRNEFIPHLHAFRGFAIVAIVGAHCWSLPLFWTGDLDTVTGSSALFGFTETLFHGSTLFFALISGLLFSRVLINRSWSSFFKSKIVNVLLPYLFLSVIFTVAFWPFYVEYAKANELPTNMMEALGMNLLTGKSQVHFWYMPILMVLFALTPVLLWLWQRAWGQGFLWALCFVPIVVSRTTFPDFISVKTVFFFLGAYTAGMLAGFHYDGLMNEIERYFWWIVAALLLTSAAIFILYMLRYSPSTWVRPDQTLFYVQKMSIAALVLHGLKQMESRLPDILMKLGSYSFGIYFLHVAFESFMIFALQPLLEGPYRLWVLTFGGLVIMLLCISLSMALALCIRRLLGHRSRWFIGV